MGLKNGTHLNKQQQEMYAARTGFVVDIQAIGKNTQLIAVQQKKSLEEIRPGIWLKRDSLIFRDGNFTNVYDFYWNARKNNCTPAIHSSNIPYTLLDQITKDQSIIAVINGSFYFLADIADRKPHDLPYNFCIRNSILVGLPCSDEPIIFTKNGKLCVKEPKARGILRIGTHTVRWVGAQSDSKFSSNFAVLYNSYSSNIIKVRDKKTHVQIGILDTQNITTPRTEGVFDVLIGCTSDNKLIVTAINKGGGSHFYDGVFILQMKGNSSAYQIGDSVHPISLDGLRLTGITSGISIGKRVGHPVCTDPQKKGQRDARSLIAKDIKGHMHFIVFDGSKYIPGFNGVSTGDIRSYFRPTRYKWAYFLDGGGSSRIILNNNDKLKFFANEFAFIKMRNGRHVWDWQNARHIASSISLKMPKFKN